MLSFSKLLKTAEEHHLKSCQVTAAMRIKPLFEQEDSLLREAAFRLLGDLAGSINHDRRPEAFKEQVCGCLITLLLHLCDDNLNVVKVYHSTCLFFLYYKIINLLGLQIFIEEGWIILG